MAKYTVADFAEDILKTAELPLLFQEIWSIGKETEYYNKLNLQTKTPWQTIGSRLFVDIRDNPDSKFVKVGKSPARFFLKARIDELPKNYQDKIKQKENQEPKEKGKAKYHERDLHPLLAYMAYANVDFNNGKAIYTKTIYHEKSKKSGLNEWVHPDMVGFYIPINDWSDELLKFNEISESNSIKLYSFELKKHIDKSNYREYFFQAVSNSSWANEGYLVTAGITQDDDLMTELGRLSNSFGIGIILLDLDDFDSSRVLFQAKAQENLDWELMNKLCDQNSDFRTFIDDVVKDNTVKTIHPNQYDTVMEKPEEYIKKLTG